MIFILVFVPPFVRYYSQELKNRFDRFAESVLQTLIVLLSNSAKIMASSANVAIRFILEVSAFVSSFWCANS